MRKKLPCLLLSGALALGLAACAPGGEVPGPNPGQLSAQSVETEPPAQPVETVPPAEPPSLSPEPPAPPLPVNYDLPDRDYQPWQMGYMDFLSGLAWADLDSRGLTTEAGEYYWPAYEGLAVDERGGSALTRGNSCV